MKTSWSTRRGSPLAATCGWSPRSGGSGAALIPARPEPALGICRGLAAFSGQAVWPLGEKWRHSV